MKNRIKNKKCDGFGCDVNANHAVVSFLHPVNNLPIWRNYCFSCVPLHCPECKFSVGLKLINENKKIKKYKCQWCGNIFTKEL